MIQCLASISSFYTSRDVFSFQVVLYNRKALSERLSNAQVTIGYATDGKGNAVCNNTGDTTGMYVIEVNCAKTLEGRYVTVTVPNNALTLCEVEVIGKPSGKVQFKLNY